MSKQAKKQAQGAVLSAEGSQLSEGELKDLVERGAIDPEQLRAATREASALERKHYANVWELRQRIAGQLLQIDAGLDRWRSGVDAAHVAEHTEKLQDLAFELASYLAPHVKSSRKAG